jgi:hypothetical protein
MTIADDLRATAVAFVALAVAPYLERPSPDATTVAQAAVDAATAFFEQARADGLNACGLHDMGAEPDAWRADRA